MRYHVENESCVSVSCGMLTIRTKLSALLERSMFYFSSRLHMQSRPSVSRWWQPRFEQSYVPWITGLLRVLGLVLLINTTILRLTGTSRTGSKPAHSYETHQYHSSRTLWDVAPAWAPQRFRSCDVVRGSFGGHWVYSFSFAKWLFDFHLHNLVGALSSVMICLP